MQFWRVDRIEDDLVVLENDDRTHTEVSLCVFAGAVREGDVVYKLSDGKYCVSSEATAERKKALSDLQKKIFGD